MSDTLAVDLNGVVAVVTGASRGAGRSIAVVLGQVGATVYLTGRSLGGRPSAGGLACVAAHLYVVVRPSPTPRGERHAGSAKPASLPTRRLFTRCKARGGHRD